MSCDGPGYEHMNKQGIVAPITGDNKKEADKAVEDEIGVSQPSKCPFLSNKLPFFLFLKRNLNLMLTM